MLKIAYYELKRLIRDKRLTALILIQPVLMIILMGAATQHEPKEIKIGLYNNKDNIYSDQVVKDLEKNSDLKITDFSSEQELVDRLHKNKYRGGVVVDIEKSDGQIKGDIKFISNSIYPEITSQAKLYAMNSTKETLEKFTSDNAQSFFKDKITKLGTESSNELNLKVNQFNSEISKLGLTNEQLNGIQTAAKNLKDINFSESSIQTPSAQILIDDVKNTTKKISYFDFYASAVVMLLVLITCLNMSSTSITQEKVDGTFERFFVTPYTKVQMVLGKMLTFSVVALLIAFITIGSLHFIFDAALGNIWLVLLVTYLTCLCAISIGLMVSSFSHTISESIQVTITIFFASMILTQFIFQTETMNPVLSKITWFIPFTYSMKGLRELNILNVGFMDIWQDIAILVGSVVLFMAMSVLLLKRKAE